MKTCFKCSLRKKISEFYTHKQMDDGHLGKCKECTKKDVRKRNEDPKNKERIRQYERLRATYPERKKKLLLYQRIKRKKSPEKYRARYLVNYLVSKGKLKRKSCEKCGKTKTEAHHPDYSKPLDVIWLCKFHHDELHKKII